MIAVAFATLPFSALSQESLTFSAAMRKIAANNTALKALEGEFESARLQNSADLCLPDPEVEQPSVSASPSIGECSLVAAAVCHVPMTIWLMPLIMWRHRR